MIKIDQVIRTRRRSLAIIIRPDGCLVVRAPLRTPDSAIHAFVESKAAWVYKHQAAAAANPSPAAKGYTEGQEFWFLGRLYPLKIEASASAPLAFRQAFILSQKALPRARIVFTNWYKVQALRVLTERVTLYAAQHGFTYQGIRITSAQSRWGSCSASNALNFPWRLVMAPLEVIDYVVLHELAHTRQKNHARAFWDIVKAILPDYAQKRKWLNENGGKLRLG